MKRTRSFYSKAQHFNRFITARDGHSLTQLVGAWANYQQRGRKQKKRIKRWVERTHFYGKGPGGKRVYYFHPKLLSTPIPESILEMFKTPVFPDIGKTCVFRRYEG